MLVNVYSYDNNDILMLFIFFVLVVITSLVSKTIWQQLKKKNSPDVAIPANIVVLNQCF